MKLTLEQYSPPSQLPPERCMCCQEWSKDAGYTGVCSDCYDLLHADYEKIVDEWWKTWKDAK